MLAGWRFLGEFGDCPFRRVGFGGRIHNPGSGDGAATAVTYRRAVGGVSVGRKT